MAGVETVLGPVSSNELGVASLHEHALIDVTMYFKPAKNQEVRKIAESPVTMEILGAVRRNYNACRDNLRIEDEGLVEGELRDFRVAGGGTMVCLDVQGIGRDVKVLKRLSKRTGVKIVAGTGWYRAESHPPFVKRKKMEQLEEQIVIDLTEGIEDTEVKAGVIGEIAAGAGVPFHPDEEKVFRAACRAQRQTGAAMTLHPALRDLKTGERVLLGGFYVDVLEKEGADPAKFYLSHADSYIAWIDYLRGLMDRGVTLSFDGFGYEVYFPDAHPGARVPSDAERQEALLKLLNLGYEKNIVLSHDLCSKVQYKKFGGYGMAHIMTNTVPELRYGGVSNRQIRTLLVDNPRRLLSR